MNSSSRVKLLTAVFGLLFVGSVAYLIMQGREEEEVAAKDKAARDTAKQKASPYDHPRCPDCGKELPASGECPFCLMKKKSAGGGGGMDPPSRFGRGLAYFLIGSTLVLGGVHLAMFLRARRRVLHPPTDDQLKTRCPHCKRRVRFPARLDGLLGTCPTCKKQFTFKSVDDRFS